MNNQNPAQILISTSQAQPATINGSVLPPLSCEIVENKMVFLIGSNYSIAQAYMQMLAGIKIPDSGQTTIFGNDIFAASQQQRQALLPEKIGMVLHGGALLSVLNGIENIKLAARYHQTGDEQIIQQKASSLLSEIPVALDNEVLPAFMSELQRRLLAIARALMLDPQVLFIDTPFDGLGHHDKTIIGRYISTVAKNRQITLIVCSDDLYFAHSLADQIIFCDNDEALVFESWIKFYECKHAAISLLFEQEHSIKNA